MPEGSKSPGEPPSFLLCQRQAPRIAGHADMQACRHAGGPGHQDTRTPLWPTTHPAGFLAHLHITCAKRNTPTTTGAAAVSQSIAPLMWDHHHHHRQPLLAPCRKRGHEHDHPEKKEQQRGEGRRDQNAIQPPVRPSVRTSSVGRGRGPRLRLIATPGRRGRRLPNSAFIAHLAS